MNYRTLASHAALLMFSPLLRADSTPLTPTLDITTGLAGEQARVTWPAQPGVFYRIEKSSSLSSTGEGSWSPRALVQATGTTAQWVDTEPTGSRDFFRVPAATTEVFSIEPAVISPGGMLLVRAQCLPAGAALFIEMESGPPLTVPLVLLPDGTYMALLPAFPMPAVVTAVSVVDGGGAPVVTVNQTFEVTATGRASDAPVGEPPGAPQSGDAHGQGSGLGAGKVNVQDISYMGPPRKSALTGGKVNVQDISYMGPPRGGGLSGGKVSYSDLSVMGQTIGGGDAGSTDMAITTKGVRASRTDKNGNTVFESSRAPGLPGEVSLQQCDLSLAVPAGPSLDWVRTYRSKKGGGFGGGWTSCFDIRIEPIPLAAGAAATRIKLWSGDGRSDVMVRQPDGTFRCDGMFREGHFNPDTSFTLTFADKGQWIFCRLVGAPWTGRIGSIVDRNGVGLTCTYTPGGQLATVSSQFGQSLTMAYNAGGQLLFVSDQTGRFVDYTYYDAISEGQGSPGDLKTASSPQIPGLPPVAGPTTCTYTNEFADDARKHNLLTLRDGANRLLAEFTYTTVTDPAAIDYDTCASVTRPREAAGHVTLMKFEIVQPGVFPPGSYMMLENDPLGRVTETVFDAQHRSLSVREYTGFATPGVLVTSSTNRPTAASKLRPGDPAFFETTFTYNPDHCITRATAPMGSHHTMLHARELNPNGPVRERGNVRVITFHEPGGAERTATYDYLPGFGTGEGRKAGKDQEIYTRLGSSYWHGGSGGDRPMESLSLNLVGRRGEERPMESLSWDLFGRKAGDDKRLDYFVTGGGSVWDGGEGGGGCTDADRRTYTGGRFSLDVDNFAPGGGGGGGAGGGGGGGGGSQELTRQEITAAYVMVHHQRPHSSSRMMPPPPWGPLNGGFCTLMTTSHGQRVTTSYDIHGNCTAARTPIAGAGMDASYNSSGQCTSVTVLNGPGSSFRDECVYDAAAGFCTSVICDKPVGGGGLQITTTCVRNSLGLVTSVTDPNGFTWLCDYNALDLLTRTQTPVIGTSEPSRISTDCFYDSAGLLARCDAEHRDQTGALVAANPAYSTFYVRDSRARLVRIAEEERPVNASTAPPVLDPEMLGIGSFAVVDFTLDDAGQCVRVSTPAACREQPTDAVCDYIFDERGKLFRGISGGIGAVTSTTVQIDYDPDGAEVRATLLPSGPGLPGTDNPTATCTWDGFHRLSTLTDPMGNVVTYAYDEQGYTTISVFGEANDVQGTAGNVLLASGRGRASVAYDPITLDLDFTSSDGGGMPHVKRLLPAIQKIREAKARYRPAFFDIFVADDVWTWERFAPGAPAPHATETTTVNRSPAGLVQSVTCNGDSLLTFTYDTAARPASCSNGVTVVVVARDQFGNVTTSTRTDHATLAGTPDKSFTVTFLHDPLNRCTSATDSLSSVSSVARDSMHRPVILHRPGGLDFQVSYDSDINDGLALIPYSSLVTADVNTAGVQEVLRRDYCRSGECRSATTSTGYTTYFTADSRGAPVQTDFPDGTHEDGAYDPYGRLSAHTQQDGSVRTSTYDLNGRVISDTWTNVPLPVITVDQTSFAYDGLGHRVSTTQGASFLTWTYDSLGNELSESHNLLTLTRTFNHRGRTGITYPASPDGTRFRFSESRDYLGRLQSCSAVNGAGTLVSPPVVTLEYSGHRELRDTRANGIVTVHTYRGTGDPNVPNSGPDFSFDQRVRTIVSNAAGTVLSDYSISRDRNQDVLRLEDAYTDGSVTTRPLRRKIFTLDRLGRITRCITRVRNSTTGGATFEESNVAYTLDLEGKRLTAAGGLHPGSYAQSPLPPALDRPMSQYTTWPGGDLTWSDNGNLTHMSDGTNSFDCIYDCLGRLVGVSDSATGSPRATYAFDGEGRRTRSSGPGIPSVSTYFVYDGDTCVQELSDDGFANLTFATGGAGGGRCITSRNGTLVYPHGGGGTSLITRESGVPGERLDSDDAGRPIFLTSDGLVRQGATSALTGYRWILNDSGTTGRTKYGRVKVHFHWDREGAGDSRAGAWCPETGFFQCRDSVYSPQLGQPVSLHKDKKKEPAVKANWDLASQKKV